MDSRRGAIIPPNLDIFHHRALQERSPNLRHEYGPEYFKRDSGYFKHGRPWHIGSDVAVHRPLHVSDPRNISKPKLTPFEKEQVFQKLWMQAWSCESFTKYRNNQKKCSKRAKDQIWSDRNEYLFFRGLVEFWPTGRVQQIDDRFEPKKAKGKPEFGRNELIARWMGQELGYEIKRKEISSHLQVLKAKFRSEMIKDDFVLYWLGLDPKKSEAKQIEAMAELVPRQVQRDDHVLEPVQFDMRIREIDVYGRSDNTAHLLAYSTASAKKMDQYLTAMPAWRRDYPILSNILDDAHHQGVEIMLVDCPLSLVDASELREIRTNAANKNYTVDLSIQNKFRVRDHISARETWDCKTTFFQKGEALERWINEAPVRIKTDAVHTHWDGEYQTLMIPFKSDHWLDMIVQFANRLDNPLEAPTVEQDVEDMLVVQEIHKHQKSSDGEEAAEDTTVLVILWTFHTCSTERHVPSTWHTVFLPFESIAETQSAVSEVAGERPPQSSVPLYMDYDYPSHTQTLGALDEVHEIANLHNSRNNSLDVPFEDGQNQHNFQSVTQAGSHTEQGFDIPEYHAAAIPGMGAEMKDSVPAVESAQAIFDPHLFEDFHNVSSFASSQGSRNHSQFLYDPFQTRQQPHSQPTAMSERQLFLDPFNPHQVSASFPPAFWYGAGPAAFPFQTEPHQTSSLRRPAAASFDANLGHVNDLTDSSIDLAASGRRLQRLAALQPLYRPASSCDSTTAAHAGQQQQHNLQMHSQTPTHHSVQPRHNRQDQPSTADAVLLPTLPSQNIADFPEPLMSSAASSPTTTRSTSPRHARKQAVAIAPHEIQEFQHSPLVSPTHVEMGQLSDSAALAGQLDLPGLEHEQPGYFSGARRGTRRIEELELDEDEYEDGGSHGAKRRKTAVAS